MPDTSQKSMAGEVIGSRREHVIVLLNIHINCLLNVHVYIHRLVLLAIETFSGSGQLMQRLIDGQHAGNK